MLPDLPGLPVLACPCLSLPDLPDLPDLPVLARSAWAACSCLTVPVLPVLPVLPVRACVSSGVPPLEFLAQHVEVRACRGVQQAHDARGARDSNDVARTEAHGKLSVER